VVLHRWSSWLRSRRAPGRGEARAGARREAGASSGHRDGADRTQVSNRPALSVPAGLVGRGAQPPPQAGEVGAASAARQTSSPSSSTRWRPSVPWMSASSANRRCSRVQAASAGTQRARHYAAGDASHRTSLRRPSHRLWASGRDAPAWERRIGEAPLARSRRQSKPRSRPARRPRSASADWETLARGRGARRRAAWRRRLARGRAWSRPKAAGRPPARRRTGRAGRSRRSRRARPR
jgi:hypothetical protein